MANLAKDALADLAGRFRSQSNSAEGSIYLAVVLRDDFQEPEDDLFWSLPHGILSQAPKRKWHNFWMIPESPRKMPAAVLLFGEWSKNELSRFLDAAERAERLSGVPWPSFLLRAALDDPRRGWVTQHSTLPDGSPIQPAPAIDWQTIERWQAGEDVLPKGHHVLLLAGDVRDLASDMLGNAGTMKSVKRRRRRTTEKAPRPLTTRQTEVVQIVGECQGNFGKAAKQLALDPKTVREHYQAAMKKLGRRAVNNATKQIPTDKRGQKNLTAEDDRRG